MRKVGFGAFDDWREMIEQAVDARTAFSFIDLATAPLDDFDAVVPLQAWQYEGLARRPDLLGRKFLHPSPAAVSLCDDKLELAEFLVRAGFAAHVPAIRGPGAPYPYIWKRRSGYFGLHCRMVTGPDDERELDLGDDAWFAQEAVPGDVEYAAHILRAHGQVRYVATVTYEMGGSGLVRGALQAPLAHRLVRGSAHIVLFAQMLARLEYEGTACINYKLQEGRPRIFEINPRMGGSLVEDINAYLDAYFGALRG